MPELKKNNLLLDLPWEVRRPIILLVLAYVRNGEPAFIPKLIQRRLRLRNCFSDKFSEATNIYVRRHKDRCLQGNGLRATNRQLRHETDLLIDQEIKSGRIEIPFVLDVMIVKEIGVFPTWISCPYQPRHLDKLTINLRIVQPGTSLVPDEWVEAARSSKECHHSSRASLISSLMLVIALYAFGSLSIKPDPTQPAIERSGLPLAMEETTQNAKPAAGNRVNTKQPSKPIPKKSISRKDAAIVNHKSTVVDAYLVSSPSYVADKLLINFMPREYDVYGKLVSLGVTDDDPKKSRFYKEGYVQFSRELFDTKNYLADGFAEWEEQKRITAQGRFSSTLLDRFLRDSLSMALEPESDNHLALRMLARSVGELVVSDGEHAGHALIQRPPIFWANLYQPWSIEEREYSEAKIASYLEQEMENGDEVMIELLRTVQIRRSHGWVRDDD